MSRVNAAYSNWIRLHDPDESWKGSDIARDLQTIPEPLYYACLEGLAEVTVNLITIKGADVNAQGGRYGNALQAASYSGHEQIVRLLVYLGADVNAQGGRYGNALQAASIRGHEQIVRLLVDKGAGVNSS